MKIDVEPKGTCPAVLCRQENCKWDRVCANHISAGDFRSEGGPRPILKLLSGEVHCDTFHSPGNGCEYHEEPVNVDSRPWNPDDVWNMNIFLWSQLVEETDNYEI